MTDILNTTLPADLPENWENDQVASSPDGVSVGLTKQHGYNYLNKEANQAQIAINSLSQFINSEAFRNSSTIILNGVYTQKKPLLPLSSPSSAPFAATVGTYALFGGLSGMDAYDENLTRTTITPLSAARYNLAATTVGGYALFGGGYSNSTGRVSTVDAYDASLTRTTPTPLSVARDSLAATTVGGYAIFAGGGLPGYGQSDAVDAYDASLTRTTPTPLSVARDSLAATTVGNYAIFGGGANRQGDSSYDANLTLTEISGIQRSYYAAATVGNYALFGGGYSGSDFMSGYDEYLTSITPERLSYYTYALAATTVGNYALFGGGQTGPGNMLSTVDAYDENLTRTTITPLSVARSSLSATTVGGYAIFAGGGLPGYGQSDAIDVYDESLNKIGADGITVTQITIPPFSRYKFYGYHTEEQFTVSALEWGSSGPISGYIKRSGFGLTGYPLLRNQRKKRKE